MSQLLLNLCGLSINNYLQVHKLSQYQVICVTSFKICRSKIWICIGGGKHFKTLLSQRGSYENRL